MNVVHLAPLAAFAVLGALVVLYLGWAYLVARGVRFRPVLMGATTALYLVLFFVLETAAALGASWLVVLNLLLVALAADAAFVLTLRSTRVFRDPGGRWAYRGSPTVVIVWLVLLLLEIYVQQILLGHVALLHLVVLRGLPWPLPVNPAGIPRPYRVALAIVDALFALGTGLAAGTNVGTYAVIARTRAPRPRLAAPAPGGVAPRR